MKRTLFLGAVVAVLGVALALLMNATITVWMYGMCSGAECAEDEQRPFFTPAMWLNDLFGGHVAGVFMVSFPLYFLGLLLYFRAVTHAGESNEPASA